MDRGQWGSRIGFILAASGSAVGLGNIWKFPYITGENGGGLFVLIYLACIALVGLPVMLAEIVLGRRSQRSPVGAFQAVRGEATAWRVVGWMGVLTGFIVLSYYSVVAGWSLNYFFMSVARFFEGRSAAEIGAAFDTLYASADINLFWHAVFMVATVGIVLGGVRKGIETWSRFLMPALFVLMLILAVDAVFQKGFAQAVDFLFVPRPERLTPAGLLEALGHSFFTLSLGMGALITYGSYLPRDTDVVTSSILVSALDTVVALTACLILFPVIFSFGMEPTAGPGLVFKSMPIAFSQMPGGMLLAIVFFVLLFFAALTSAISLLEVVSSTVIDQLGWTRRKSVLVMGTAIGLFGIPSALSGSGKLFASWEHIIGKNFFDTMDYFASNWLLPIGGLFIAVFVGWVLPDEDARDELTSGSTLGVLYRPWRLILRYLVPIAILLVIAHTTGIL